MTNPNKSRQTVFPYKITRPLPTIDKTVKFEGVTYKVLTHEEILELISKEGVIIKDKERG